MYPSTRYAYTIQPVYRASSDLVTAANRRLYLEAGPRVEIETQGFDGEDAVIFNRAVASSQAFSRRFPDLDKEIEAARAAGTLSTWTDPYFVPQSLKEFDRLWFAGKRGDSD